MKKQRMTGLAAALAVAFVVACGGAGGPAGPKTPDGPTRTGVEGEVATAAVKKFDSALAEMARRDEKADWNDAACTSVAQQFLDALKEQKDAGG